MWGQTRTDGLGGNRERRIGHWARSWRRKCRIGLGREVVRGMDHFYLKRGLTLYTSVVLVTLELISVLCISFSSEPPHQVRRPIAQKFIGEKRHVKS